MQILTKTLQWLKLGIKEIMKVFFQRWSDKTWSYFKKSRNIFRIHACSNIAVSLVAVPARLTIISACNGRSIIAIWRRQVIWVWNDISQWAISSCLSNLPKLNEKLVELNIEQFNLLSKMSYGSFLPKTWCALKLMGTESCRIL